MKRISLLFFIILLLAACAPATETAVLPTATIPPPIITEENSIPAKEMAVPSPTEPAVEPTATTAIAAEPTEVEVAAETGVMSGRTEDGAFFLGDPHAPITHIDYSDFL